MKKKKNENACERIMLFVVIITRRPFLYEVNERRDMKRNTQQLYLVHLCAFIRLFSSCDQ